MVLGFKRRFAPFVKDGSKQHSIREDLNDRWKIGRIVDAFVDPRQKTMERLMPSTPCIMTESIRFEGDGTEFGTAVYVNGAVLDQDERNMLAWKDGFRHQPGNDPGPYNSNMHGCFGLMMEYWTAEMRKAKRSMPWSGKLVHWKFPSV